MDLNRLAAAIEGALAAESLVEQNPEESRKRIAQKLAKAFIDEVKELQINYNGGLTAPNGPVSGNIIHTVS